MAAQDETPEKDWLDVGAGSRYLVSIRSVLSKSFRKLTGCSSMVATIIKTVQIKSLRSRSDYTCELHKSFLLSLISHSH